MKNRQTILIFGALLLGIAVGYACNTMLDSAASTEVAGYFAILTDIFLRMIKMIIAPLIFSTFYFVVQKQWPGAVWLSVVVVNAIAVPLVFLGTRTARPALSAGA